ncbi:MAG: hypothetical protein J7647_03375 [Cyanobacteria bacterium SBLK]|nr:hypothetical protein [Cyanobacteria bacterium SBLK]
MSQGPCSISHGIECPKCRRHTVISIDRDLWKCLNCDFSKDFSKNKEDKDQNEEDNTGVFITIGGVIITVLCLLSL